MDLFGQLNKDKVYDKSNSKRTIGKITCKCIFSHETINLIIIILPINSKLEIFISYIVPANFTYTGFFKFDKLHGKEGTKVWADGRIYHEDWNEGNMHGKGKLTY